VIKDNEKICKQITAKDKVTLLVPLIRKYYSFYLLDFVRNTYIKLNNKDKSNERSM